MANKTVFPNGLNIRQAFCAGGTAGSHSVSASFGLAVGDVLDQVVALTITTAGAFSAVDDLSDEFTAAIATASTIVNTAGTNTTGAILIATFAKAHPTGN